MKATLSTKVPATQLRFPHKRIRSQVIADYVRTAGYRGVVVFSCGNAASALRQAGLEVVEVGPRGDLAANKWWTMAEIHRAWPDLLDATSGHLPVPLMGDIANSFRTHLGELPVGCYSVPSGSGETITCLRIAYPLLTFSAAYDSAKPETTRHEDAPLNALVDAESLPTSDEEKAEHAQMMERYGHKVSSMPQRSDVEKRRASPLRALAVLAVVAAISSFITILIVR